MAAANFGISAGAALLGTLEAAGGPPALLWAIALAQALAILLLGLARVGR